MLQINIILYLTCRDQWKGYVPPYFPRFSDGWQPSPSVIDEHAAPQGAMADQMRDQQRERERRVSQILES